VQRTVVPGLEERLAQIAAVAERKFETPHELETALRGAYHVIFDADLSQTPVSDVSAAAPDAMARLFALRIKLRDRIAEWDAAGIFLRPAQSALRAVFRIARYASDMLGEIAAGHPHLASAEAAKRGFSGTDHNTLIHPAYDDGQNIPFRSGDVILMRGSAHNSAAIARIGDVDSQFSHIAIVYIDDAGQHWMVEALIEDGSVINTLEHTLHHGLGRAVLYRFKDPALAARAAKLAYERVLASKTGAAPHIPYDFSMRLNGRRKLFCAKLVAQSYADASKGKVELPAFRTRLDLNHNRSFFKSIGVRARETFAPCDIDLDPRFDLVAEWQNYAMTPVLRRQDMIMTKFFEWMEKRGYHFREDFLVTLIAVFGRLSSYLSERVKTLLASVVPKVPRNMSRACVATIVMLHKSAEEIMPGLTALDEDHVRMTGYALHPRDMLIHIERLREVSPDGHIGYLYPR